MYRIALGIVLLIVSIFHAKAQTEKKIKGDSIIISPGIHYYSVKANLASIDWIVLPKSVGTIVFQSDDSVGVFWAKNHGANNLSAKIGALITYPNADNTYNTALTVSILPQQQQQQFKPKAGYFSATSDAGLRLHYSILCDTLLKSRAVVIEDSSSSDLVNLPTKISVLQNKKIAAASNSKFLKTRLSPGRYVITITKQSEGKTLVLSDTLVIFPSIRPEFRVSTQTPCSGTVMSFSITNKSLADAIQSTYHFGNGDFTASNSPLKQTEYTYNAVDVLMTIYMAKAALTDKQGCVFESKEIPVAVQENKFTLFNTAIKSARTELKHEGDTIHLQFSKGNAYALPNPNVPYTYQWSTGQKDESIVVKQAGNYSVVVTDKFGCVSTKIGPVKITKSHLHLSNIKVRGASSIQSGKQAIFFIESDLEGWFQFKFIFNDTQSVTIEPTNSRKCALPEWQNSRAGSLQVIGYFLAGSNQILASDTLLVNIQ